jgi:hypothetical protein
MDTWSKKTEGLELTRMQQLLVYSYDAWDYWEKAKRL